MVQSVLLTCGVCGNIENEWNMGYDEKLYDKKKEYPAEM
jgi:hypothetical protein